MIAAVGIIVSCLVLLGICIAGAEATDYALDDFWEDDCWTE